MTPYESLYYLIQRMAEDWMHAAYFGGFTGKVRTTLATMSLLLLETLEECEKLKEIYDANNKDARQK